MIDWQKPTADRWLVTGIVETRSPVAIRTGIPTLKDPNVEAVEPDQNDLEAWFQKVEEDAAGQPVLSASALKGFLRSLLAARGDDGMKAPLDRLFGCTAPEPSGSDEQAVGQGGRAEFRNARMEDGQVDRSRQRGRVSIHRGAGSAADGLLRTQDEVMPGTRFRITVLIDGVAADDVALLVAALRLLDGGADAAIGSGAGQGFGRIAWLREAETVKHWDAAAIARWVDDEADGEWLAAGRADDRDEADFEDLVAAWSAALAPRSTRLTLNLAIQFDGFFLVSEAVEKTSGDEASEDKANKGPDRVPLPYRDENGDERPLLPGTGFKGPLRAQCERIWRTLSGDVDLWQDASPKPIAELFGSTGRAGALRFSDFVGPPMARRRHELVAIDRFTGGAADKQKFSHDVFEAPHLTGRIWLETKRVFNKDLTGKDNVTEAQDLSDEALGLLALALRDLAEGDIAFGYGTRKGYGAIREVTAEADGRGKIGLLDAFADELGRNDGSNGRVLVRETIEALQKLAVPAGRASAPQEVDA